MHHLSFLLKRLISDYNMCQQCELCFLQDNIFEQGGNKTSYEFVDDLEESYENVHSRPDIVQVV